MRVAEICPTCATYINASCIVYDGDYLSTLNVAPLDTLDDVLSNINDVFTTPSGAGIPSDVPLYYGQFYIDTDEMDLYIGLSTTIPNWGLVATIITTTTTTTSSTTTTTTTTP